MKNNSFLKLFVVSVLVVSCTRKPESTLEMFDASTELQGEVCSFDSLMLGNPYQILLMDSLLLIADPYEENFLSVVDLKRGRLVRRALKEGKGPDELLPPVDISLTKDTILGVYERTPRRFSTYTIADILRTEYPRQQKRISFDDHPGRLQLLGNERFIAVGPYENGCLGLYDREGKRLGEYGRYPKEAERFASRFSRFLAYQSRMATNPDGKRLITAGNFCDRIVFYEETAGKISETKTYFFRDAALSPKDDNNIVWNPECLHYFSQVQATGQNVYILYEGYTIGEEAKIRQSESAANRILVFDWNGNPVKAYAFDRLLANFCVSPDGKTLYGIVRNPEPAIVKYTL